MPFRNDGMIIDITTYTHVSKFWDTSKSAGEIEILLHIGVGVESKENGILGFPSKETFFWKKSGLFSITEQLHVEWNLGIL